MALKNVCLILVVTLCLMAYATTATMTSYDRKVNTPGYDLAARLQAYQGQFMECWNSLQKLTSCSSLAVQFFLTGKADIASCCSSIDIIWSKCTWPSAVTSLGYTPAEANILKTYCDAVSAPPANRKP